MRVFLGFVLGIVFVAVVGFGIAWSGLYDIRATTPHHAAVAWVFGTAMERGVRRGAATVAAGPEGTDELLRSGAREFAETCATCHGAPGKDSTKWAMSMEPTPPDLGEAAKEWSRQEVFWIVRNGIKMTGMPAFGSSHSDAQIWALATFVKALPGMEAARFQDLARSPAAPAGSRQAPAAPSEGK